MIIHLHRKLPLFRLTLFLAGVFTLLVLAFEWKPYGDKSIVRAFYQNNEELELLMKVENSIYVDDALGTAKMSEHYDLKAPARQIEEVKEGEKICYLTFDDGPSENTEKVLDVLKQYNAKATFFVIGESVTPEMEPVLKRICEEGHAIGLHAEKHTYRSKYESLSGFLSDYEALARRLKELGIETALFRFPGGSACTYLNGQGKVYIQAMREYGFACFDWNVSGEDSVGSPNARSIQQSVFRDVFRYDTPMVLLHDSSIATQTIAALPEILKRLCEEGYCFQSLEHAEEYIFPDNR